VLITPWKAGSNGHAPSGGCKVRFTPGVYFLHKPIDIPPGVTAVSFLGVQLYPCAEMPYMIILGGLGPPPAPAYSGLFVDDTKPCGTYQPGKIPNWQIVRFR
jgi:hypothetical protein